MRFIGCNFLAGFVVFRMIPDPGNFLRRTGMLAQWSSITCDGSRSALVCRAATSRVVVQMLLLADLIRRLNEGAQFHTQILRVLNSEVMDVVVPRD